MARFGKRLAYLLSACFICAPFLSMPALVRAETYDVTARVPAELPPDLPIVTSPTNTTTDQPTTIVTGTCPVTDPPLIVVLLRDNQTIGSGPCSDEGTFSVLIPLVLGKNVINVKFMTITGESSGTITIILYYDQPAVSTRPNKPPIPVLPPELALALLFDYDFVTYTTTQPTTIRLGVSGGTPPYKVFIGWGDNSSKSIKLTSADTFNVTHQYRNIHEAAMKLTVKVTDAKGRTTQQQRALISFESVSDLPASQPVIKNNFSWLAAIWYFTALTCLLLVTLQYKRLFLKPKPKRRKK